MVIVVVVCMCDVRSLRRASFSTTSQVGSVVVSCP